MRQWRMPREPFDFSCAVVLPDGTSADIQQTDIQDSPHKDRTIFVAVRPHDEHATYMGALHLSSTSLHNLDVCPGGTRAEKSQRVAAALQTWVKAYGLAPDFLLDLTVDVGSDLMCRVAIASP